MYCSTCGTSAAADQNHCKRCGALLRTDIPRSDSSGSSPPPLPATREGGSRVSPPSQSPSQGSVESIRVSVYARIWKRLLAIVIDYLVAALMVVFFAAIYRGMRLDLDYNLLTCWVMIWMCKAAIESSRLQATPGKLALGIKITSLAGDKLSFLRAAARFLAQILSGFVFGIGYVIAGFTKKRQALHDLIAGTLVVNRSRTPAEIIAAPPATGSEGIVLVVLLIPAIGIMAAIAIPAYQDYTIRAQTTEGIKLANSLKMYTAQYYSANGIWPTDLTSGGDPARASLPRGGDYVGSMAMPRPGTITITFGNRANPLIAGKTLSMNAYLNGSDIIWVCGNGLGGAGLERIGVGQTSVPSKYLPAACNQ